MAEKQKTDMKAFILSGALIKTQVFIANDAPVQFALSLGYRAVDLWRWLKGNNSTRQLKTGIVMESTDYCTLEELAPEDFRQMLALWAWKQRQPKYTEKRLKT